MRRQTFAAGIAAAVLASLLAGPALAGRSAEVRTESFRLLNQGVAAYNRGDIKEAIEKLQASAGMALNSFRAYYYLGLALTAGKRFPEAVDALQVAIDLDPSQVLAHVALGDAYLKGGETGEAQASYVRALKIHAELPQALDGIARAYEATADDDNALTYFRRAIVSNKGYAEAYVHLGDLYLRKDRFDDAIRLLLEAVTVRPDFAPALNRLALAYSRMGLQNEAIATIRKAIALEPKVAEHRAAEGEIELALDLPDGAEASFREALAIDPSNVDALGGMAEIARRRGEYAAALAKLDAILATGDLDGLARKRFAARRGSIAAESDLVARIEPRVATGEATPEEKRALAAVYARRGQWGKAADLQGGDAVLPSDRERYGYFLLRAGRFRAAQPIYADLERTDRRADLAVNEGIAFAGLGDDASAVAAYRRALELDPLHADARLYLGSALLRLGRKDDAVAEYKKFVEDDPDAQQVERIRRILGQIAPDALPPPSPPAGPAAPQIPSGPEKEGSP